MTFKQDYTEFQKEIVARGITHLVHFTSTENLVNIFSEGKILSRQRLESKDIKYQDTLDALDYHDSIRFDDKQYINLSVQHPNSFLFEVFKKKSSDTPYINWCVLLIDVSLIYKEDTLFSITNAANSHNKPFINDTLQCFKKMFSPSVVVLRSYGEKIINRNGLRACYPTDAQAEVLAKDEIKLKYIKNVCFLNKTEMNSCKSAFNLMGFPTDNFIVNEKLYNSART